MSNNHEITQMLQKWSNGDDEALDELMPLVYEELRRQAARYLRSERPNHTLQTTALIHEAYLRLIDQNNTQFNSRAHFFAISAKVMRRILVDHARARTRNKRGGMVENLQLDEAMLVPMETQDVNLVALDEALNRLKKLDERQARIVELRYFGGMTLEQTAEALKVSRSTVAQNWTLAKAWLHRELTK